MCMLYWKGCGRTDFQQGDSNKLYDSIHQKILSLPDEYIVFPGHDYNGEFNWKKRQFLMVLYFK